MVLKTALVISPRASLVLVFLDPAQQKDYNYMSAGE